MQTLDQILQEWCVETGVPADSPEALKKASTLVRWFEFGVRGEEELWKVIRDDVDLIDAAETSN